jgi:hypothetical protein
MLYGSDVAKLAQNMIVSTGADLATSVAYRVVAITSSPAVSNGLVAYATKI